MFFGQSGNWNSRLGTIKNRLSASINQNLIKSSSKNKLLSTSGRHCLIFDWNSPFFVTRKSPICRKIPCNWHFSVLLVGWMISMSRVINCLIRFNHDIHVWSWINISPGVVLYIKYDLYVMTVLVLHPSATN